MFQEIGAEAEREPDRDHDQRGGFHRQGLERPILRQGIDEIDLKSRDRGAAQDGHDHATDQQRDDEGRDGRRDAEPA